MFEISTAATDLAGNGLAATFSSSFTTLRRITSSIPGTNVFDLSRQHPIGPSGVVPNLCTPTEGNNVGRSVSQAFTSIRKLYVTPQIPSAPTGVTAVETAVFRGLQTQVAGARSLQPERALRRRDPLSRRSRRRQQHGRPHPKSRHFFDQRLDGDAQDGCHRDVWQSFIAAGQDTPVMIRLQFGALPSVNPSRTSCAPASSRPGPTWSRELTPGRSAA